MSHSSSRGQKSQRDSNSYADHIPLAEVESRLAAGTLLKGTLRVNAKKRKVAYVKSEFLSMDICIEDENLRNRAIHTDVVCVEILPQSQWLDILEAEESGLPPPPPPADEVGASSGESGSVLDTSEVQRRLWQPRLGLHRDMTSDFAVDAPPAAPMHAVDAIARRLQKQPTGRVVCIVKRIKTASFIGSLGTLSPVNVGSALPASETRAIFRPSDARYPHMLVNRMDLPDTFVRDPHAAQRCIYLADMREQWPRSSKMPFGYNVRSAGEMGSIQAETEALLIENDLNHGIFSDEVLEPLYRTLGIPGGVAEGHQFPTWTIPAEELAKRRDLRGHRIFSIDPPTARDLDDALHVTQLDDDIFEIGCHIADVSYFVEEGSALDEEAKRRATSVYLVQKVIPMLPPILCEHLCSLNPNVDRLAFSCIWKMRSDGTLLDEDPWYGRTVIRSCAKLDYPTAQRMIEGQIPFEPCPGEDPDAFLASLPEEVWETARRPVGQTAWECSRDVRLMHLIASQRRQKRFQHGALTLSRNKLGFRLNDQGNPIDMSPYLIRESNQLVEEYMLLGNYLVAQELLTKCGQAAFLRSHPLPKKEKLRELLDIASQHGIPFLTGSAQEIQRSMERVTRDFSHQPEVVSSLTNILMHSMYLAKYLAVSTSPPSEWAHFALAIPYYTHFTSPIRRYADVTVHRLLDLGLRDPEAASALGLNKGKVADLSHIADICNVQKQASKTAQERSERVFLGVYLQSRGPTYSQGVVVGIGGKSFTVVVEDFNIEQRIFVDDMPGVQYRYDERAKVLSLSKVSEGHGHHSSKSSQKAPLPAGALAFKHMQIRLFGQVTVILDTVMDPFGVSVSLVGPLLAEAHTGDAGGAAGLDLSHLTLGHNGEDSDV